jgi:hypothetical protein
MIKRWTRSQMGHARGMVEDQESAPKHADWLHAKELSKA